MKELDQLINMVEDAMNEPVQVSEISPFQAARRKDREWKKLFGQDPDKAIRQREMEKAQALQAQAAVSQVLKDTGITLAQLADPTGITGYPDLVAASEKLYKEPTLLAAGSWVLALLGSLPVIGGLGKITKVVDNASDAARTLRKSGEEGARMADKIDSRISKAKREMDAISRGTRAFNPKTYPIERISGLHGVRSYVIMKTEFDGHIPFYLSKGESHKPTFSAGQGKAGRGTWIPFFGFRNNGRLMKLSKRSPMAADWKEYGIPNKGKYVRQGSEFSRIARALGAQNGAKGVQMWKSPAEFLTATYSDLIPRNSSLEQITDQVNRGLRKLEADGKINAGRNMTKVEQHHVESAAGNIHMQMNGVEVGNVKMTDHISAPGVRGHLDRELFYDALEAGAASMKENSTTKELDQLVENFFQPKSKAFGLEQLVEMVEDLMGEAREKLPEELVNQILSILKKETDEGDEFGPYPIEATAALVKDGRTSTKIVITNTGQRGNRRRVFAKIDNHSDFEVLSDIEQASSGTGLQADVIWNPSGKPTPFKLILKRGSNAQTISNIGNFAEGVMAYALAAKLENSQGGGKEAITLEDIKAYAEKMAMMFEIDPTKKRQVRELTDQQVGDDKLNLTLGLDTVTFADLDNTDRWVLAPDTVKAALKFANSDYYQSFISHALNEKGHTINIIADGVSDQKGTKADIFVNSVDEKGNEVNLQSGNISLKTKSTKQLHQTGKDIKKIGDILDDLYGYKIGEPMKNYFNQSDREDLFGVGGFFDDLFKDVAAKEQPKKGSEEISYLKRVSTKIPQYAAGAEVSLIQLTSGDFKIFDFTRQIADDFTVRLDHRSGDIPKLITYVERKGESHPLFSMRPRRDGKGFRFYIEKEKGFDTFYKFEIEKQEQEQKDLTNPPQ